MHMPDDPRPITPPNPAGLGPPRPTPSKKKSLLEWIMLSIGLSYGDEGEDKWARQRAAAADKREAQTPERPPPEHR